MEQENNIQEETPLEFKQVNAAETLLNEHMQDIDANPNKTYFLVSLASLLVPLAGLFFFIKYKNTNSVKAITCLKWAIVGSTIALVAKLF